MLPPSSPGLTDDKKSLLSPTSRETNLATVAAKRFYKNERINSPCLKDTKTRGLCKTGW
jgi:hypothetical protein